MRDDLNQASGSRMSYDFQQQMSEIQYAPSAKAFNLKKKQKVVQNLISQEQARGHAKMMFSASRWQQEKDNLLESMNFHMTNHRPTVRLTNGEEARRLELSSHQILGDQLLQKKLTHFGIKVDAEVTLPPECQTYLDEGPALWRDKLR